MNMAKRLTRRQMLLVAAVLGLSPALAEPVPDSAKSIELPSQARPLAEVLKEVTRRSGIKFHLAEGLGQDKITATLNADTWQDAAKALLHGYNYAVESGEDGRWQYVTITGRNGDGKYASPNRQAAILLRANSQKLPVRYQGLKPGSVTPINLPLASLKKMKPGQKISLDLPSGQQSYVHDNRFKHGNGDTTWVAYSEPDGPPYRAMLTWGQSGPIGHIVTPEGMYQLETEGGQSYLIDINASGLQAGSLLEDQASPEPIARIINSNGLGQTGGANLNPASGPAAMATIDLLVLHPKGLAQAETRVNYLTALTNQAFLDSKINAQIRVVHRQPLNYTEANDNSLALSDLTDAKPPFDKVAAWREKYRADLVSLIRPFHANTQKSCGTAWVNGSYGIELSGNLIFSVVSDGSDQDGGLFYCGGQTLAHELGHNLGNVHDRAFSDFPGAFSYSYAWGVEGRFGTIMSYRQPAVLLFASPLLTDACQGQVCGYAEGDPNAADNARTINQTAPVVAGFK